MARPPAWTRPWLAAADFDAISRAIIEAEAGTSAEIRVHLERRVKHRRWGRRVEALQRAQRLFTQLGMHRTLGRNGVLIYLALADRKLAIVGDEGIHTRVGDRSWQDVRDGMVERLRQGRAGEAIVTAVAEVGRLLARHFPRRPDDVDELPPEVSTS
jgi:uncharacterized membrane protein